MVTQSPTVYNPVISGWCIPLLKFNVRHLVVYNPVISGWCIPQPTAIFARGDGIQPCYFWVVYTSFFSLRINVLGIQPCYFRVVYTVSSPSSVSSGGIQPCYFRVVYTRHRYSVPQSAGCHLSHNKPANRVFLLPRQPCISTGVNSGYTVRTQFFQSTSRIWTSLMRRRASSAYSSLSSIPMNSRPYR